MFFTVTSRIQVRLQNESYGSLSEDLYPDTMGRLEREAEFAEVRSAIVHLMKHAHYEPHVAMARSIREIGDLTEALLAHPEAPHLYSKESRERIRRALGNLLKIGTELFNERYTEEQLARFVEHGTRARNNYARQGYNPEAFLAMDVLAFAALIRDNYGAWEQTLNHVHI